MEESSLVEDLYTQRQCLLGRGIRMRKGMEVGISKGELSNREEGGEIQVCSGSSEN